MPQPQSSDPRCDSHHTTSARTQCGPAVPWSVDTDTIRLVDSWRIDVMLRYLHMIAQKFISGIAARMVQNGDYMLTPPKRDKTPAPRLWASPWPFMGYSERHGIGLISIHQISSPYHTNLSKSIPSSSVYTIIPLAGKVSTATKTCRVYGDLRARTRTLARVSPQVLRP